MTDTDEYDWTSRIASWKEAKEHCIGYPCNTIHTFQELYQENDAGINSFAYNFNNVGDPFVDGLYSMHTKKEEREVLRFFAELWNFDWSNVWGYITNSGTEGNMQGLLLARENFPDGVLYYSEESHYSITKIAKMLQMNSKIIKCRENGEMDYDDFEKQLDKDKPAIVCVTFGTTMKGAIDNPRELQRILNKYNMGDSDKYYMHADAALMGFVLPFLELDTCYRRVVHSISVSGHKMLGVPFPCGIFMTERRFVTNCSVEYIGSIDNTIMGSRNGHAALFMHNVMEKYGKDGLRKSAVDCLERAEYMVECMRSRGVKNCWRNNNSITVVFPKVTNIDVCRKWQIASHKTISHVVVMPQVTHQRINRFMHDLQFGLK